MLVRAMRSARGVAATVVAAAAIAGTSAGAASAATIYPGAPVGYYTVCAQTLTHHLAGGGTVTLTTGHNFLFDGRFGDGINHVWGYNQGNRYGWVQNGWFC